MEDFNNKVIVVTGGASGIGFALAKRFKALGGQIVLSDLNNELLETKAQEIGALAVRTDVGIEEEIKNLVGTVESALGHIDMFVSNAGIAYPGGVEVPGNKWATIFSINVLSHVFAAKYALPGMIKRKSGYFLNTASAAGLLVEFNAAPYTATKHAAVGFAEWLALAYKQQGIGVSVLCPAAVKTPMIAHSKSLEKYAIDVEELVDKVIEGLKHNRFMISTHEYVDKLFHLKGNDFEEYMKVMEGYRNETKALDNAGKE